MNIPLHGGGCYTTNEKGITYDIYQDNDNGTTLQVQQRLDIK